MAFNKRVTIITAFAILFLFSRAQAAETLYSSFETVGGEADVSSVGNCEYIGFVASTTNVTKIGFNYNVTNNGNTFKIGLATSTAGCVPGSPYQESAPFDFATSTSLTPGYGTGYQWYYWTNPAGFQLTPGQTYYLKTCSTAVNGTSLKLHYYNGASLTPGYTPIFEWYSGNCNSSASYGANYRFYYDPTLFQSSCTSWTYSDWSTCNASSTQSRTVATSSPANCVGGSPILTQSCTYTTPIVYATSTYNIDSDMQKVGTTLLSFVTRIYQSYWPFILSFSVVAGFSFAIGRLFKKLG